MSKTTQKKKSTKTVKEQKKELSFRQIIALEEIDNLDLDEHCLYLLDPKENYTLDFYLIKMDEISHWIGVQEYIKEHPEHKNSELVDLTVGFCAEKEVYDELAKIKTIYSYDVDMYCECFITTYKNLKIWLEQLISEGKLFVGKIL